MKSTIFHLENQTHVANHLTDLLQRHIYPGIATALCNVNTVSTEELGTRYSKLLQAAADPVMMLRCSVKRLEYSAHRLYIEVYHYFWSGTVDPATCFPAIALDGRMVMVPPGLRRRISPAPLFRDLENDGLIEVDFADNAALEQALGRIAEQVRTEAMRNLAAAAAYMDMDTAALPDIGAIADRAGVDAEYIQHCLRSAALQRIIYKQLKCDVQPVSLPFGRWTKVEIRIQNNGDEDLRDVTLVIRGPVRVRPQPTVLNIDRHAEAMIPVALLPEDKGEFPIELQLFRTDDRLMHRWLPVQHVWLSCD